MHLFSTTAPLILIYNRATDTDIIPTRLKYTSEGVLKRLIVYLSSKQTVADFYDLAFEVMNEGKYSSEFGNPESVFFKEAHLINSLIPRINCQSNKEELK